MSKVVEPFRKRFLTVFRSASSRLHPCINLQWAWIGQNPPDLADLDFKQNRPASTIDGHRRPMQPTSTRVSAVVHSQIGRGTTPCAITKSGSECSHPVQLDESDGRRFRDFAVRTDGQDTVINGMPWGWGGVRSRAGARVGVTGVRTCLGKSARGARQSQIGGRPDALVNVFALL